MNAVSNRRILIVDDTEEIHRSIEGILRPRAQPAANIDLEALEADLFGDEPTTNPAPCAADVSFPLTSAYQGQEALALVQNSIERKEPFAAAFVDMRMPPGWDGLETIEHLWAVDPDLQIVICTAYSDRSWSEIRTRLGVSDKLLILKKPFDAIEVSQLAHALTKKWELLCSERQLLEQTLTGSIEVMSEMLALVNPVAFERVGTLRRCVLHLAERLKLDQTWAYGLAGMLSQVGSVTVPAETLDRSLSRQPLEPAEQAMLARVPEVTARLVARIPRLAGVAKIIVAQQAPPKIDWSTDFERQPGGIVAAGANLLAVAVAFDDLLRSGESLASARAQLRSGEQFHPKVLEALEDFEPKPSTLGVSRAIAVGELTVGMVLDEDLCARNGLVIAPKGVRVTASLRDRIQNFASGGGVKTPFRIRAPARTPSAA